jgi:hypothetical protein
MIWHQKGSLPPKNFKTQLSAGTITASVFKNSKRVTAQYYSNLFFNDVHQAVQKRYCKLSRKMFLMKDVCSHTANLIKATMATMHWKIINLPPHSPDYILSDFHLFGPVKVHIGQTFQANDKLNAVS